MRQPFTQIDKRCSENSALSLKAKGMLSYLLGKPDDWKIRISDLIKNNADGEVSIRSTLKELEKKGHLKKQRTRDKFGRYKTDYIVYEIPQLAQEKNADEEKIDVQKFEQEKKVAPKEECKVTQQEEVVKEAKTELVAPLQPEINTNISPIETSKNEENLNLHFGPNLASLTEKEHNEIANLLKDIPEGQKLLNVLNQNIKLKNIHYPVLYLKEIINQWKAGKFSPARGEKQERKQKFVTNYEIEACSICNDSGRMEGYLLQDNEDRPRHFSIPCGHTIKWFNHVVEKAKIMEVETATDKIYQKPTGDKYEQEMQRNLEKHNELMAKLKRDYIINEVILNA